MNIKEIGNGVAFLNLTPHTINLLHKDIEIIIQPSEYVLRAEEEKRPVELILDSIPIYTIQMGRPILHRGGDKSGTLIDNFNQFTNIVRRIRESEHIGDNTWLYIIASLQCLHSMNKYLAEPGRCILNCYTNQWSMYSVADVVRDDKGVIIGCKGLSTL